MRISDWSSDVCSSDLCDGGACKRTPAGWLYPGMEHTGLPRTATCRQFGGQVYSRYVDGLSDPCGAILTSGPAAGCHPVHPVRDVRGADRRVAAGIDETPLSPDRPIPPDRDCPQDPPPPP